MFGNTYGGKKRFSLLLHCCSHTEPASYTAPVAVACVVFTNVWSTSVIRSWKPHQTPPSVPKSMFSWLGREIKQVKMRLDFPKCFFLLPMETIFLTSASWQLNVLHLIKTRAKHVQSILRGDVGRQGLAAYQYSCLVCSQSRHHRENI